MKYLTYDMLKHMYACEPALKRFKKLFGKKARVTFKNVCKFAEEALEYTNNSYCSWLIDGLLFASTQDIRNKFENCLYKNISHDIDIHNGYFLTGNWFDARRTKALYQLLKVVNVKQVKDTVY
jgi:hypothetical protein